MDSRARRGPPKETGLTNQKWEMGLRARRLPVAMLVLMLTAASLPPAAAQSPSSPAAGAQAPTSPAGAQAPAAPPASDKPAEPRVNDFPTLARVEYVFECLSDNPGPPRHEMVYKCVCAVDRVAEAISYDRWVDLSTFFKAQPMAGERGAYVRERSDIQAQLRSYREVQLNAKKACFIPTGAK
jgi:hypothetical protein